MYIQKKGYEMSTKLKQYNVRIEEELLAQLQEKVGEKGVSEFIRQAITEKLDRRKISTDETYHRIKQLDKLDTESIHTKVVDIEFTNQVVYEEVKKQNEILKLLLRRTTFSSMFGKNILDTVTQSDDMSKSIQVKALELITDEINQLKV